jgi:hypothetical protein
MNNNLYAIVKYQDVTKNSGNIQALHNNGMGYYRGKVSVEGVFDTDWYR